MSEFKNKREEVLLTANQLVNGDRNVQYGDPNADFQRTADMWNMLILERINQFYLTLTPSKPLIHSSVNLLSPSDVGLMMIMLKCSRQMHSPKLDNWIDISGYAACAADCEK